MRKVLLAATAVTMVGGIAGSAFAQTPAPAPTGAIIGGKAAGFQFAPASATPSPDNDPGTMQAYFRARLWFDAGITNDSYSTTGTAKQAAYTFAEFARIYPSFEGTAANGLKYGAYLEVRQNSNGTTFGGGSSDTTGNTLFWRRQTGYVGGDFGQVRFGQTDAPIGLFSVGTGENFSTGGWNGDYPQVFNNPVTAPTWGFSENGGSYSRLKVVYLSPQFAGFDFGASFQPNTATSGSPAPSAGSGSSTLQSLSTGAFSANLGQLRRTVNDLEGVARYRGSFGPIGLTVTFGAHTAGTVHDGGTTGTAADGSPKYRFSNPTAIDAGVQVTFGGLAVGGHYLGGNTNPDGTNSFVPIGSGGGHSNLYSAFTSYAFGSAIVGVQFFRMDDLGANTHDYAAGGPVFGKRNEYGVAVGGGYNYAPGASVYLEGLYGQRHQYGYSFLADARSLSNNNTHAAGLILTNYFNW